jgi:hypothetical protein
MRQAKNGSGSETGKCDRPKTAGGTDVGNATGGWEVLNH